MKTLARLAGISGIAVAAVAALAAPASASPTHRAAHHDGEHTVFVQSDNPAGNTVVAYDRTEDGTLALAGSYATGGLGGVLDGSVVDHLASQGALTLDSRHNLLFAVNAGSNTLTVFGVRGDHLERRQVISSGGQFPVSIAVHGDLVYVANALGGGSIQGYLNLGGRLVLVKSWHRGLGLDSTQTPQFTHTPGHVIFSPNGRQLIVTTKAAANTINVFKIDGRGAPSHSAVVNPEPGLTPFAATFDPSGHLVIAEAGTSSVATFDLNRNGTVTHLSTVATGQKGTCWIVGVGTHLYASNASSGTVTDFAVNHGGQLTNLGNTATDAGTVDAEASSDGRYLYVQAGAAGVVNEFKISRDGSLKAIGSLTVPGAIGGEGIAAS
jgi:6-phosphogluconolactonase (cycloisomerase 2 family)